MVFLRFTSFIKIRKITENCHVKIQLQKWTRMGWWIGKDLGKRKDVRCLFLMTKISTWFCMSSLVLLLKRTITQNSEIQTKWFGSQEYFNYTFWLFWHTLYVCFDSNRNRTIELRFLSCMFNIEIYTDYVFPVWLIYRIKTRFVGIFQCGPICSLFSYVLLWVILKSCDCVFFLCSLIFWYACLLC